MRGALRTALVDAMRRHDREAMSVYRSALAAIDNAEAVPLDARQRAGAVELSPYGLGAAEVPRRLLDEADLRQIVRQEAVELRTTAGAMAERTPDVADRLRRQAAMLDALVEVGGDPALDS